LDETPRNWNSFRTFEAVARLGSLTAAARALGVSQSTVSRQLAQLEAQSGATLLFRESPVRLTDRGRALLDAIGPMVEAALAAESALEEAPELRGTVSVATVGELVRWLIVPSLPSFYASYPELELRLLADNQLHSLAAGDADLALRFARPDRGDLVARRVHTESYALFAAAGRQWSGDPPWLGLAGSLAAIPEQRYAERVFAGRGPRLLVEDVESLGVAVQSGLGVAVLPRRLAVRLGGLEEVAVAAAGGRELEPLSPRSVWLVVHRSRQRVAKVRAVFDWVARLFESEDRY